MAKEADLAMKSMYVRENTFVREAPGNFEALDLCEPWIKEVKVEKVHCIQMSQLQWVTTKYALLQK